MLTLKERLKLATQKKEKMEILKNISEKFSLIYSDISLCEYEYNTLLACLDNKSAEKIDLSSSDEYFFMRFCQFLKKITIESVALFYIETNDNFYLLKIPISFIKKEPRYFWSIKKHNPTLSNCILIDMDCKFAFINLYSEYYYELYSWM